VPRRRRSDKRRTLALTAQRELALTAGPDPRGDEPDAVLVQVYAEHRERIDGAEPWRAWAWWYFGGDPSIPDELRGDRPRLVPIADAEHAEAEALALDLRRAMWLRERAA
jgi:hypothetical protein